MSNVAIKVENLGKKYVINHELGNGDDNFREVIIGNTKKIITSLNPFSKPSNNEVRNTTEDFWALNDVNFEINKGDKVGIIGRNGAGKSTLLKVLSRITEPTTGKIHINGRIASLLEVGTGFHPELTGRENIYLNGAILGMSRKEIKSKFDEIVAFAEVEKFLDTPVKRYSSGMYVRLAFSVAAHLEPEILVVDEVLAVGDVEFQKKCLGKMNDISKEGRTILFVSHNMSAIENLCNKGILMKNGQAVYKSDNIRDLVLKYLKTSSENFSSIWENNSTRYNHSYFVPKRFWVSTVQNAPIETPLSNEQPIKINIEFDVEQLNSALLVGFRLYTTENELVFVSQATDMNVDSWEKVKLGHNSFSTTIPSRFLNEGDYRIELVSSIFQTEWLIEPGKEDINIYFSIQGGLSDSPYWIFNRGGLVAPVLKWQSNI